MSVTLEERLLILGGIYKIPCPALSDSSKILRHEAGNVNIEIAVEWKQMSTTDGD